MITGQGSSCYIRMFDLFYFQHSSYEGLFLHRHHLAMSLVRMKRPYSRSSSSYCKSPDYFYLENYYLLVDQEAQNQATHHLLKSNFLIRCIPQFLSLLDCNGI